MVRHTLKFLQHLLRLQKEFSPSVWYYGIFFPLVHNEIYFAGRLISFEVIKQSDNSQANPRDPKMIKKLNLRV